MPLRRRSAKFRVLLVDPDDATGVQLNAGLDSEVFEVMCVNTDTAAYAVLQTEGRALNALITDTNLGSGTTGFDVARHARRLNAGVAVIFLSHGGRDSVERFGVTGAAHIARPYDPALLVMVLRELAAWR